MIQRVVIDTNVFISRALRVGSNSGMAVDKAWLEATTLFSAATWAELNVVLRRAKFAPYIQPATLGPYLEKIRSFATFIQTPTPIHGCRDPKDDKFLEVAVHGRADGIVTGDSDLLGLHPFRGIAIVTPADYIALK
jgi:putative PIN family toxin of toxin-antitoxin system